MGAFDGLASLFRGQPAPVVVEQEESQVLDGYKADLHRMNLISLGKEYTPDDINNFRRRARFGDPRFLFAAYDELLRLGPGPQRTKAIEAMKGATAQYVTSPEDWDENGITPEDANPADVAVARAARDYLEEVLEPQRVPLTEIHADQHFYGIADSKIVLDIRGIRGRYDAIDEVEPIPARRHRLDVVTHQWMLMLSPDSWQGEPVSQLALRGDRGTEGIFFTEIGKNAIPLDQRGLFFQVLVPWGIHQHAVRWRARRAELFDIPPRIGYTDTTNPKRATAMRNALRDMGATFYGVFHRDPGSSSKDDVQLLQAAGGGTNDPQEAQIDWCLRQYDLAILGHSQTTGVQKGAGSRTSSNDAQEQFENLTNSRLLSFATQLRRGLARVLVARAFGEEVARRHTPIIKLTFAQRDDPDAIADRALKMAQAGLGSLINGEDVVRRAAFTVAEPGERTFGPTAVTGAPPTPLQAEALSPKQSRDIEREFRALLRGSLDRQKRAALAYVRGRK